MEDHNLRPEFVDQLKRLKTKVGQRVKVKAMNGHGLNGPMLVELANTYIEALNDGCIPNISSAWKNVTNFEQERAFKTSIEHFL